MTKVKWKSVYHDSFDDPEDWYEYKEGELISVVSGFLGIRKFGIVKSENSFYEINFKDLIIVE